MTTSNSNALDLIILIPVFDDWESAALIVQQLDAQLAGQPVAARVLFLDDSSRAPAPADLVKGPLRSLTAVESLRLRRNLGHQRALSVGLSFVHAEQPCDAVLIMDADGEDKPEDVPRLIRQFLEEGRSKVIFAQRLRRSEGWVFRFCYRLYRFGHRILTGVPVRVGNFSILSADHVATLAVVSDTWNHYAASVVKSRIAHGFLPTERGRRLAGRSHMDFPALVLHGLSAISVFAETVSVRLILGILAIIACLGALLAVALAVRWSQQLAIPGWAIIGAGLLLLAVMQMLTVALGLSLLILFNRSNLSFLPLRDYRFFVGKVQSIYARAS
jgi:polyisoprenyl-phosphate glycosyltransferase